MPWGRGFGSARFDHFFQNRAKRFGLLKVNVVACTGNSPARDRVVGIRAKVGKDLAIFRVKLPGQIAYGNALRSQLAKRANRLAPQRHLVGTRLLERERERFRVVGKAARPKTFSLVIVQVALTFEQGQARPPGHESGHSFAPHARGPREVALAKRFTCRIIGRPESCAFKNERGKGRAGLGHLRHIVSRSRCRIPLTAPSHVKAASSIAWSEGCGASERNAVELAAIPQVVRSKARRLKRHAPAHGVPNQNGRHTCVARNDPTKSKERSRLEAQVERLATWNIANRRASALPMPRKLESKALHARARKRQGNFIPGGSLLREAVDKHDRDRWGVTFPRIRRRSTPRLHAKAHALEIEAARLPPNLARHFAALLQNLACHLRRPSFDPDAAIQ